jgi:hypothetical protein
MYNFIVKGRYFMKNSILFLVLSIFVYLSLSGCPGWDATPKAGFERMAAAHLKSCVQNNSCQYVHQCFLESAAYCVDAGYSPTCGQMEPEGSCGINVE